MICIVLVWWVWESWGSSRLYFSVKYDVPLKDVTVFSIPHDCEWSASPLGDKHCHYEAKVNHISTSTSATGEPLVSDDEGKTWTPNVNGFTPFLWVTWWKAAE